MTCPAPRYDVVCFDVDGTLYPARMMRRNLLLCALAHPVLFSRYSSVRKAFRPYQEGREFSSVYDMPTREALIMAGRYGELELPEQQAAQVMADPFVIRLKDSLTEIVYPSMARMMRHIKPFRGVRQTMEKLCASGVRIGVLSDFPLGDKLRTLGVSDLVTFAADCLDCRYLKPDKRCFDYLVDCGRINRRTDRVLFVGDSWQKDVAGALQAGWDAALIGRGGPESRGCRVFEDWETFDRWLSTGLED